MADEEPAFGLDCPHADDTVRDDLVGDRCKLCINCFRILEVQPDCQLEHKRGFYAPKEFVKNLEGNFITKLYIPVNRKFEMRLIDAELVDFSYEEEAPDMGIHTNLAIEAGRRIVKQGFGIECWRDDRRIGFKVQAPRKAVAASIISELIGDSIFTEISIAEMLTYAGLYRALRSQAGFGGVEYVLPEKKEVKPSDGSPSS